MTEGMEVMEGVSPRRQREPRQGILPFVIRHGNGEEVTAHAGLPLVVEAVRAVRLEEVVEAQLTVAKRERGFSETEKDRKSTRLNSSHSRASRMPSSA